MSGQQQKDSELDKGCKEIKCFEKNIKRCDSLGTEAEKQECRRTIQNRIDQLKRLPNYGATYPNC